MKKSVLQMAIVGAAYPTAITVRPHEVTTDEILDTSKGLNLLSIGTNLIDVTMKF